MHFFFLTWLDKRSYMEEQESRNRGLNTASQFGLPEGVGMVDLVLPGPMGRVINQDENPVDSWFN
jgi:hypothetical protein